MGSGDLSFLVAVVATAASVTTLFAFGFMRRRETVAWETGMRGGGHGTELHVTTDPDIARRIASLVRRPDEWLDEETTQQDPSADERLLSDGSDEWPAEDTTDPVRTPVALLSVDSLAVAVPDPAWPARTQPAAADESGPSVGVDLPAVSVRPATVPDTAEVAWPTVAPDREVLARLLVDPLTGLGTVLAWDIWVADEEARVRRYHRPATIVLAELDGLDAVGAFHGPEVAEGAAAMIGAAFRANIRTTDHAAVVGPGVYAVLLPETDEVRAVNFVERVRATCEEWLAINSPGVRLIMGWASPDANGLAGARVLAERRLERERR